MNIQTDSCGSEGDRSHDWGGCRWFCYDCLSTIEGDPDHRSTGCLTTHSAMRRLPNEGEPA